MRLAEPTLQKFRHLVYAHQPDQRAHPRHDIGMNVKYRTSNMTFYEDGILHDISANGLLITTKRGLTRKTQLHIVAVSDGEPQESIHIVASEIRQATEFSDNEHTYGCVIESYQLQ